MWQLWQLADSAFPTGGFVHSGGLEAAWQLGLVQRTTLADYLGDAVIQNARANLPLVIAAYRTPERIVEWDALADAWLSNHVANRASRAQGQAWLSTCTSVFGSTLAPLKRQVRAAESPCHLAPLFGAITATLGCAEQDVRHLAVFTHLRGLVSTAVRLGLVGPMEAQRLQAGLGDALTTAAAIEAEPEDCATTAPLLDLAHGHHDRLYSRLFTT